MGNLRLGLVGLGTWAETGHLPVYQGAQLRSLVDIAALCSRSMKRAREWTTDVGGADPYDDFDAMLAEADLDVVSVCTPDHLHADYVLAALDAGCHVLVEKPLAMDLGECRTIFEAAGRSDCEVFVLYHKRADPLWAEAADRIRDGQYGVLQMGWAGIQNPITVPAGGYFSSDLAEHSDPNWFLGTHFYDLVRFMTGIDPVEVRARKYDGTVAQRGVDTADAFKVDVTFAEGAAVTFFLSWNLPEHSSSLTKQEIRLHFTEGELDLDGTRRGFLEDGTDGFSHGNPYFLRSTEAGPLGYGATYLEAAVFALVGDERARSVQLASLDDAWWASAVADAARESVATGDTVPVSAPPARNIGSTVS